jgi:hypothetical protein
MQSASRVFNVAIRTAGLKAFHTEVTEGKALTHLATENPEKILGFLRALCELIFVPSV